MSQSEIERFQSDIKVKRDLADRVKADTDQHGLGAIVDTARSEGYDFDLTELKAFVVAKSSGALSDEALAKVSAAGSTTTITSTATIVQVAAIAQAIVVVEVYGVAAAAIVVT
jgi:hypothetical protein